MSYSSGVEQITFIWRTNGWALGKVLYVFARYTPFVSLPLALASQFIHPSDLQVCTSLLFVVNGLFALRNYAMWQKHRIMAAIALFLLVSALTVVITILVKFLPSITFASSPIPSIIGCFKTGADSAVFGAYIVIIVSESAYVA
ncbi:hypothetical protein CONPUDRAFT_70581 [Coniophora puteana RWD-64-598 SS2]|uniref:Uncharacterized protein n=1 Tax=Coniophora puteana (strain RWD-64-598) TaxID=741705 RepID=A0A5M3MWZ2_CONPW|nr:uncharacterized protein CONPUDRAFT_70581 [Coniophora puteana RWD-64-598 SS2]EIW83590.1 hypothetical protein CONPUDRAFT_70581 [Coniophora puteana RWD-64-598 SS2]